MAVALIQGDALHLPLADQSVQCCVTSPPYYGLRDYGTATWEGGDSECDHAGPYRQPRNERPLGSFHGGSDEGNASREPNTTRVCAKCGARRVDAQLGLEPTPEEYVAKMVAVFREVRRVLRDDGVLWLNLGDSYASGKGTCFNPGGGENSLGQERKAAGAHPLDRGNKSTLALSGLKPKDLVGIPWRVALALQADDWWLRSDIIWHKPNPMPESVRDRPTRSHEYVFLLTKQSRYYYDADAVAEPVTNSTLARVSQPTIDEQHGSDRANGGAKSNGPMKAVVRWPGTGQNSRMYQDRDPSHSSERKVRWPGIGPQHAAERKRGEVYEDMTVRPTRNRRDVWTISTKPYSGAHFATMPPDLAEVCIRAGSKPGDVILDPFSGAGTTALVAEQLNRHAIGVELSAEYNALAADRLGVVQPELIAWL